MVSCEGSTFAGRVASSILQAVGLPELVTRNLADYEAMALRLATHPDELAGLRAKLAANRVTQPLFNTDRFRAHIETAYATMREIARRGAPPRSFKVDAIS
jgi:protein O-GlcNAc transferase